MKKRLSYIDVARGLAIFVIVLGHCINHSKNTDSVFKFLYSFHVVLFFIISGFVFSIKDSENFWCYIKSKFNRLMIPYFLWEIVFLIPYMLFGKSIGENLSTTSSFSIGNQLFNILYGNGVNDALKQNTSLWFLPALFSIEFVYYFIIKLHSTNKNAKYFLLPVLIIVGYFSNKLHVYLPWGFNTALNLGYFFYIGYLLKESNLFNRKKYIIILAIFSLVFGIIGCFSNYRKVSCVDYQYGNYFCMFLSSLFLSLFFICISYIINKNKILEYIGKSTMSILIFHKIIILVFQTKFGKISALLKNSNIIIELTLAIIISIISIFVSVIIYKVIYYFYGLLINKNSKK